MTPKIRFEVLGKKWTLRLLKRRKYMKRNGSDSVALTECYKRQIDLSPFGRDLETIVHELVHAYLWELGVGTATLDADAIEEVFAELMAKRGRELLALADSLFDQLGDSGRPIRVDP